MSDNYFRPMFSYSPLPILLLGIGIFIVILFLIWPKKKEKQEAPVIIKPEYKNLFEIKGRYKSLLNDLTKSIESNTITNRKAYQKLSNIIRNFIYEVTRIKVQNYSLEEIRKLNILPLTELVEEYYDPEFAKESKGSISSSIEKTREVIEKWY